MRISLDWIGDYVDLEGHTPEELAELLSLHTAEVEGVDYFGRTVEGVVVGHVVECAPHPDADRLSLTCVDAGGGEPVQVVCGAPNVAAGQKVAFAPVGVTLPDGTCLKKAKLRGQESLGMICSSNELGLGEDTDGILVLPEDSEIGLPLAEVLGPPDAVLVLDNKSLTHRPDLWGHYGFAREFAAILKRPLKPIALAEEWKDGEAKVEVDLEDTEGCPLYFGLRVDLGSPLGASCAQISRRLRAVGVRPHNDLVDLTNYILLELGQPTHAFDFEKVEKSKIVVRQARKGESLTTLDGSSRKLREQDLVIADAQKPIALAGVMGGEASEVREGTSRVLLESGVFHPARVRRASVAHGLRSDASSRFEKGLDPTLAHQALLRFAYLLENSRPEDKILGPPVQAGSVEPVKREVALDAHGASTLLGMSLSPDDLAAALSPLGFEVEINESGVVAQVPSWRATRDIEGPEDVLEEVGRMLGYDKIEPAALVAPTPSPEWNGRRRLVRDLTRRLAGSHQGFETHAYSFLGRESVVAVGLDPSSFVQLRNPVQDGVDLVRQNPIVSLFNQAQGNLRENSEGMLFEIGKGYSPLTGDQPEEKAWLGVVMWGPHGKAADGPGSLFGRVMSLASDVFSTARFAAGEPCEGSLDCFPWAHPIRSKSWKVLDADVAAAGVVTPEIREKMGKGKTDIGWFLFDLDACLASFGDELVPFQPPSRYPATKIDVALALPNSVPYVDVEKSLVGACGDFMESLSLFDVFEGAPLDAGVRSLAFRISLRAFDRTLSEADEQEFLKKVAEIAEDFGGCIRS